MKITFLGNFSVDYTSETHHKKSLEALGHEVMPLQEGKTNSESVLNYASNSDMFVWVHTHGWNTPASWQGALDMAAVLRILKEKGIPSVTYHLDLWFGLERQKDLDKDTVYRHIGHFFTVDKKMADWFNSETEVKGHYLHAGVFDQECAISEVADPRSVGKVIFVGSKGYHPEWSYRPQLIDWLGRTYGNNFLHVGGDGATGTVRGQALNQIYKGSSVAVGDSLCLNFDYPYYWSDRVYETLGRGGFMIHPYIKGMEEDFEDGKHLVFYKFNDFDDLKQKIDYYLQNHDEREKIRLAGHEHVKNNHTYKNRWQQILREIE